MYIPGDEQVTPAAPEPIAAPEVSQNNTASAPDLSQNNTVPAPATFELADEFTDDQSAAAAPAASQAATPPRPAGAATPQQQLDPTISALQRRLEESERRWNETMGYLQPMLTQLRQPPAPAAPPVTREQIARGEATPEQLLQYLDFERNQQVAELQARAELTARRATDEGQARSLMTAEALGEGRDFDAVRRQYIDPLYRQNPGLQQVINQAMPNPAVAEYYLGVILALNEKHGGDPVRTAQAVWNALDARQQGFDEAVQTLTGETRRNAQRVTRASGPGPAPRKLDDKAVWDLDDKAFTQLLAQRGVQLH